MPQIIDLSAPLENDRHWAPWWARTKVKFQSHKFGRLVIRLLFGLPSKFLRTGLGWANETISLSTHSTTHVDAPWHYSPTTAGEKSRTIDELPLDWFYGPGVVLDLRHLDSDAAASVTDCQHALAQTGHTLQPGDIVLIQTGCDQLLGNRAYFSTGPGMSPEATRWLIEHGIKVMGIDAWGWDAPLVHQASVAKKTGQTDWFWGAHFVGMDHEYCQIERLANLGSLPPTGFHVCAFPLKVVGGSAGPSRVVGIIGE